MPEAAKPFKGSCIRCLFQRGEGDLKCSASWQLYQNETGRKNRHTCVTTGSTTATLIALASICGCWQQDIRACLHSTCRLCVQIPPLLLHPLPVLPDLTCQPQAIEPNVFPHTFLYSWASKQSGRSFSDHSGALTLELKGNPSSLSGSSCQINDVLLGWGLHELYPPQRTSLIRAKTSHPESAYI